MCGSYTGEHDESLDETKEHTREEKVAKRIKSGLEIVGRKHWDNEESYYLYYKKDKGEEE
jgi:hypothetical protein